MNRDALIKLRSSQGEGDDYHFATRGVVRYDASGVYIDYAEEDGTKTCIGISEDTVTMSRMGEMVYTMVLTEGEVVPLSIETELGTLSMTLTPQRVSTSVSEDTIVEIGRAHV